MKIRAKGAAAGAFEFEASEEAARELIASGNYEAVDEDANADPSQSPSMAIFGAYLPKEGTADAAPLETRPAKRLRKTR